MTVLALVALGGDATGLPAFRLGLDWLAGRQNPDGSFGDGPDGRYYAPYCTALALWILPDERERFTEQIRAAVDYLRANQRLGATRDRASGSADLDRGGLNRADLNRGGIGCGMTAPAPTAQQPDATFTRTFAMVSPTSMAAEGVRRAGIAPGDPFLTAIAEYVRRCHNDARINTDAGVGRFLARNGYRLGDDGGVIATLENLRRPEGWSGTAAEPVFSSGISTYQGLTAYLRAGLAPDAPEVVSVLRWIREHYSVTEHAGFASVLRAGQRPLWPTEHAGFAAGHQADDLAQAGRYLYLFAMAQALGELAIDELRTADGARHDWRAEITATLAASQQPDGFWVNPNPRWLEFDAVLSTAFALGALRMTAGRQPSGAA